MNNDTLEVKFIEKEIVNVDFIEKEFVQVKLHCVDFLQNTSIDKISEFYIVNPITGDCFVYEGGKWINKPITKIILDGTLLPAKLSATNTPSDGQVPSYNNLTHKITWVTPATGSTGSKVVTLTVAPSDALQTIKDGADYVCDGTDDQIEIQTAIDLAGSNATILLLSGNFYISSTIHILESNNSFTFTGENKAKEQVTIHSVNSFTGGWQIKIGNGLTNPEDLYITNFTSDCHRDTVSDYAGGLKVFLGETNNPTIDNVVFLNADRAVRGSYGAHKIVVRNSQFIDCDFAIGIDNDFAVLKDNYFEGCKEGIYIHNSENIIATDNRFYNVQKAIYVNGRSAIISRNNYNTDSVTVTASDSYFILDNTYDSVISDNVGNNMAHSGIILDEGGKNARTLVVNNSLLGVNLNDEVDGYGIDIKSGKKQIIGNNRIHVSTATPGNMKAGVHVSTGVRDVKIYNNDIFGRPGDPDIIDEGIQTSILRISSTISTIDKVKDFNINTPIEKQIIIYEGGNWINKNITELMQEYHKTEEPSQIDSKRFELSQDAISGTLEVYFNGIKEKEIIIIDDKTFEFKIDTIASDIIEVAYIRQP